MRGSDRATYTVVVRVKVLQREHHLIFQSAWDAGLVVWNMAYTSKKYIKGSPQSRIRIFEMGDGSLSYDYRISLNARNDCRITGMALESIRVHINRELAEKLSKSRYHLKICVYPHHVVRKCKWLGFAGADRVSKGMRLSFGKPSHRAAVVKPGQMIIFAQVMEKENVNHVIRVFKEVFPKIPTKCSITVDKLEKPLTAQS